MFHVFFLFFSNRPLDPCDFSPGTLMVLVLFAVASIVHFAYLAWQRSRGGAGAAKGLQISLLARTAWGSEKDGNAKSVRFTQFLKETFGYQRVK